MRANDKALLLPYSMLPRDAEEFMPVGDLLPEAILVDEGAMILRVIEEWRPCVSNHRGEVLRPFVLEPNTRLHGRDACPISPDAGLSL